MDIINDGTKLHKRRLMSKYDSVKVLLSVFVMPVRSSTAMQVFVALPGYPSRSYILSRYLISRMLTVAKIPTTKVTCHIRHVLPRRLIVGEDRLAAEETLCRPRHALHYTSAPST